jgi:hypothetical protein
VVAVDDGEQQVFLAVDVVVEAPLEQADPGGDVLDPGGGVALLVEDLAGGVDDLVPPLQVERPPRTPAVVGRSVILRGERHAVLPFFRTGSTCQPYKWGQLVAGIPET